MGEDNCWEKEVVITELTKGRDLMCQLQKHFDPMKQDVSQYLAVEILSSYDKALSLLNGTALSTANFQSPQLLTDSRTKSCDRASKSTKRKMVSRRTEYVHARSGEEVPPGDGYSWRKYCQKHILGAKYPREYYRCTRCRLSNCATTKMVQRSETEPSVFEVIYGGSHSCGQENKNPNSELVVQPKETQCDEVGRSGGETSECYIPEMVSTPNSSFNNSSIGVVFSNFNSDFIPTPTSSPHADWNLSLDDTNLTALFDDVPENARSIDKSADFISTPTSSRYADWNLSLDNHTTLFDDVPENDNFTCKGVPQSPLGK